MSKMLQCWVCGKLHDYCPTCDRVHGWKYVADTHECYQIYMTLSEAQSGVMTKKGAIEAFANLGIRAENDLSWLRPHIERAIREIIGEKEKETAKTTKKSKLFDK